MSRHIYKKNFFTLGLILTGLVLFVACGDDNDEIEVDRVTESEWYAAGDDVAPLFRAFPLEIDSIYLRIRVTRPWEQLDTLLYRVYIEYYAKTNDNYQLKNVVTGTDQPGWGASINREETAFDNIIWFRTINAERDGAGVEITGIYKVFEKDNPPSMKLEYVYTHPGAGWPAPPDAAIGFGSTANEAYGDNNVHHFTLITRNEETSDE